MYYLVSFVQKSYFQSSEVLPLISIFQAELSISSNLLMGNITSYSDKNIFAFSCLFNLVLITFRLAKKKMAQQICTVRINILNKYLHLFSMMLKT